jgi:integral membrane sensor domain MASE1
MNQNLEETLAILAALLVVFSAMWEPLISAVVAAAGLLLLGVYELGKAHRSQKD